MTPQPDRSRHLRLAMSFVAVAGVAAFATACGGGDDAPAPPPAGPAFTQTDVLTVAKLGASTTLLTYLNSAPLVGFHAGFLEGFSTDNGGASSRTVACTGGGSVVATVTKTATRVGFAVGDSVLLDYASCVFAPFTFTGTARMTAQSNIANLTPGAYSLSFRLDMTNLRFSQGTITYTHNGALNVTDTLSNNGANVIADAQVVGQYASGDANLTLAYANGSTMRFGETAGSPSTGSLGINADTTVTTSAGATRVTLATTAPLAGPLTAGGLLVAPTSGTLNATSPALPLATSITVNGANATVLGDTNRDGTLDLTINTTWAALTS